VKESPGESGVLVTLQPLTKLICLIMLTMMTFFARSSAVVITLLIVMLLLSYFNRIRIGGMKWLFVPIVASIPVTLAVFILSYWLESKSPHTAIVRGIIEGALYLGRLSILLVANIVLVRTTDFRRLTEELRIIGLPATAVLLLATAFRFFPVLLDEVQRIFEVQRLRGLERKQLLLPSCWLPLALPFLVVTIQRAYELALSFYIRGGAEWSQRRTLAIRPLDVLAVSLTAGVLLLQVVYGGG